MNDPVSRYWADRLRMIAAQVKAWESRDVRDQRERGESKLSRPAFFADLEELATAIEGTSNQWSANVQAKQNWPKSVKNFERDWRIAKLIDEHRRDPDSTVWRGKEAAVEKFTVGPDLVDAAWKQYGRYWRDDIAPIMGPLLRIKAARVPIKFTRGQGEKS